MEPKENWLGFQQIDDTEKIYCTFPNWKLRQLSIVFLESQNTTKPNNNQTKNALRFTSL